MLQNKTFPCCPDELRGEKTPKTKNTPPPCSQNLRVKADLISVKSSSKIEGEYLFIVHQWCSLNGSEKLYKGRKSRSDLTTVAPKSWSLTWVMRSGAPGPPILMCKWMRQPKPAPELGGPEDADTCWSLGYVHVFNLLESIRLCVEIKACFAIWLGNDVCVCGGLCCFEVCRCYEDAEIQLFRHEAEPRHRGNSKFQLVCN